MTVYFAWGTEVSKLVAVLGHDALVTRFYGLVVRNVFLGVLVRGRPT